jgi:glycosyltransferase involved in cell wall biosynthesis
MHLHGLFSHAPSAASKAARRHGIPYIVRPLGVLNRWGMENRRRLVKALSFRLFDLPMLERAAAMHYTSRMELEDAARFGLTNIQRVIPIGIDLSSFRLAAATLGFQRSISRNHRHTEPPLPFPH